MSSSMTESAFVSRDSDMLSNAAQSSIDGENCGTVGVRGSCNKMEDVMNSGLSRSRMRAWSRDIVS